MIHSVAIIVCGIEVYKGKDEAPKLLQYNAMNGVLYMYETPFIALFTQQKDDLYSSSKYIQLLYNYIITTQTAVYNHVYSL